MNNTVYMEAHPCPYCDEKLNAATNVEEKHKPGPGDITLCLYCCNILYFDDEMVPTRFTKEEWEELDKELQERIHRIQDNLMVAKKEAINENSEHRD